MRKLIGIAIGGSLLLLGLIGLIIPVLPGVLFILLAALVFAAVSPRLRRRLSRNPRFRRLFKRMDHSDNLPFGARCKLAFWATLEALNPPRR